MQMYAVYIINIHYLMKPFHMTQINHYNVIKLNIVIRNDSAELGSLQPSKTQALHSFTI
jgi:hypothetical protein